MHTWDRAAEGARVAGSTAAAVRAPLPAMPMRLPFEAPAMPLQAALRVSGAPAPHASALERTAAHLQLRAKDPLAAAGLSPSGRMTSLAWEKAGAEPEAGAHDTAEPDASAHEGAAPEKPAEAALPAYDGGQAPLQMACASDCGCAKCGAAKDRSLLQSLGIQRQARPGAGPPAVDGGEVRSRLGAGSPLPAPVVQRFSNAYGRDLSSVRVHANHALADQLGARAFTVGRDVAFAPGEYRPGTPAGDRLIGHELAHVVQQAGGEGTVQGAGLSEDGYEAEADSAADKALAGHRVSRFSAVGRLAGQAAVQRKDSKGFFETVGGGLSNAGSAVAGVGKAAVGKVVDTGKAAVGAAVELGEGVVEKAKEGILEAIRLVSPGLADFLEDPLGYLETRLLPALQSWVEGLFGVDLSELSEQAKTAFTELTSTVSGVIAGDEKACLAFAAAVQKVRDLYDQIKNSAVVKKIASALSTLKGGFDKVSKMVLAPAFDVMRKVAGGAWSVITKIAETVGGWIDTVKQKVSGAIDWISQKLGFADGPGLLDFLRKKAQDIWAKVQKKLEPVATPLKVMLGAFLAMNPAAWTYLVFKYGPDVIEAAKWLWAHRNDPNIVKSARAEKRATLAKILATVQNLGAAITGAAAKAAGALESGVTAALKLAGAVTGLPILSVAKGVADSIVKGLQSLASTIGNALKKAGAWVSKVAAKVAEKIAPISHILLKLGMALANPPMIPVMLAGWAWLKLPDCYKGPVIDLILDALIGILDASPSNPVFGPLWALLKPGIVGFVRQLRKMSTPIKVDASNKIATFMSAGSPQFMLGYAKGLLSGIWDNTAGTIGDLIELGHMLVTLAEGAAASAVSAVMGTPPPAPAAAGGGGTVTMHKAPPAREIHSIQKGSSSAGEIHAIRKAGPSAGEIHSIQKGSSSAGEIHAIRKAGSSAGEIHSIQKGSSSAGEIHAIPKGPVAGEIHRISTSAAPAPAPQAPVPAAGHVTESVTPGGGGAPSGEVAQVAPGAAPSAAEPAGPKLDKGGVTEHEITREELDQYRPKEEGEGGPPPVSQEQFNEEVAQLGKDLKPSASTVAKEAGGALKEYFKSGSTVTYDQLVAKLGDAWGAAQNLISAQGAKMAREAVAVLLGKDGDFVVGQKVGWIAGMVIVEVVTNILTGGGAAAAKQAANAAKAAKAVSKPAKWTARALESIVSAFKAAGKFLMEVPKKLQKLAQDAKGALSKVMDAIRDAGKSIAAFVERLMGKAGRAHVPHKPPAVHAPPVPHKAPVPHAAPAATKVESKAAAAESKAAAAESKAAKADDARAAKPHDEPVGAEPKAAEPKAAEPHGEAPKKEASKAREERVKESGQKNNPSHEEINDELDHIGENQHLITGEPPERKAKIGEHEWREGPDGQWCRHSETPTNCAVGIPNVKKHTPIPDSAAEIRAQLDQLKGRSNLQPWERKRIDELETALERQFQIPQGGLEPPAFKQMPGESLSDYEKRMKSLATEVEERATRAGGDIGLHETYQRKLDDIQKQMAQLPGAEARLASVDAAYRQAYLDYHRLREARLKAGKGAAAITSEERAAKKLVDQLEAERRLAKAEVDGLNRVGSPQWKDHGWGDMGNHGKRPCFAPGTVVKTPGGDRAIETLREGDLVYAFDVERRVVAARRVLRVHGNWTEHLVRVGVAGEVVSATRRHPFWIEERRSWIEAHELQAGEVLRGLDAPVAIESVEVVAALSPTVNLEVEELESFFVGRVGVLVHNGGPDSIFADPALHDSKFYRIIGPLPNPPGGTGVVYVGKTWQETIEQRFGNHMSEKGWTSPPYRTEAIDCPVKRKMTAYETAVWEKHYIEQYKLENQAKGIQFGHNGNEPLWNDPKSDPINEKSYRDHRDRPFNRPCD